MNAIRVCAISDVECSRGCGAGKCKHESTSVAADAVAPSMAESREGDGHVRVLADLSAGEFKPMLPELGDQRAAGQPDQFAQSRNMVAIVKVGDVTSLYDDALTQSKVEWVKKAEKVLNGALAQASQATQPDERIEIAASIIANSLLGQAQEEDVREVEAIIRQYFSSAAAQFDERAAMEAAYLKYCGKSHSADLDQHDSMALDFEAGWTAHASAPQATGLIEQHHRDSAELRRLCAARDQARRTVEYWKAERNAAIKRIAELAAVNGPCRILLAACNRLWAEAEEIETPDGLGQVALQSYWDEFVDARDKAADALLTALSSTTEDKAC